MSMSDATGRTWIALGLAEVLFTVTYPVCAWLALVTAADDTAGGWAFVGQFVTLLVAGVFFVLLGVPIGVHTVGRLTAKWMDGKSSIRASSTHLAMGLVLGALVAAAMIPVASMDPAAAVIAFVVPLGLVGFGTNLLMPLAVSHEWVRITAWVLGAMPVFGAMLSLGTILFGARR